MSGMAMLEKERKKADFSVQGINRSGRRENRTGIPSQLKERMEQSSGLSFDDVRVHYNSDLPARLDALAYTKGNRVEIGPGQERHLPHELGHVVQQKLGIVRANAMHSSGTPMNTDPGLEHQADEIGAGKRVEIVQKMEDTIIQRCNGDSDTENQGEEEEKKEKEEEKEEEEEKEKEEEKEEEKPEWYKLLSDDDKRQHDLWDERRKKELSEKHDALEQVRENKEKRVDPRSYLDSNYVEMHLAMFNKGASFIMTVGNYISFVMGKDKIGYTDTDSQYVMPTQYCDGIMNAAINRAASAGNAIVVEISDSMEGSSKEKATIDINYFEETLGFPKDHFMNGGGLVRIDVRVDRLAELKLDMAKGTEGGTNSMWEPGGATSGGIPEGITHLIPNDKQYITFTFLREEKKNA